MVNFAYLIDCRMKPSGLFIYCFQVRLQKQEHPWHEGTDWWTFSFWNHIIHESSEIDYFEQNKYLGLFSNIKWKIEDDNIYLCNRRNYWQSNSWYTIKFVFMLAVLKEKLMHQILLSAPQAMLIKKHNSEETQKFQQFRVQFVNCLRAILRPV